MQRFLLAFLDNLVFLVVLMPFVGAVLVGLSARLGSDVVRRTAIVNAIVTSLLAVTLAVRYASLVRADDGVLQMMTTVRWLATSVPAESEPGAETSPPEMLGPNVRLSFGADGTNVGFLLLVALLTIPVLAFGPKSRVDRPGAFYTLLLLYEGCLLGAFGAWDVLTFCVFSEGSLLPAFLLLGAWGGYERRAVARRFLTYNLVASGLVLTGMCLIVNAHHWASVASGQFEPMSFNVMQTWLDVRVWTATSTGEAGAVWAQSAPWAFLALLIGFAIRMALPPLHTWLVPFVLEAPTPLLLLFGAAGTKLGLYGVLRFVLPLFPERSLEASGFVVGLSVLGVVYAGLMTLAQGDLRKLLGCSLLAQGCVSMAGAFTGTTFGFVGATVHAVQHGFVFCTLASLVHVIERRYGTRDLEAFGGLSGRLPRLTLLFTVASLALIGAPGGLGFVSQWLVLGGVFTSSAVRTAWLAAGILLGAWAFAWLLQRVFQGRFRQPIEDETGYGTAGGTRWSARSTPYDTRRDLTWGEFAAAGWPLVVVVAFGLLPSPVIDMVAPTAQLVVGPTDPTAQSVSATRTVPESDSAELVRGED